MAIGTPIIDAANVQRAFTTDLSGIQNSLAQQALIQQRAKQQAIEQQNEKDIRDAALLQQALSEARKTTGTPFDTYANGKVSEFLNNYKNFKKENPRASYSDEVRFFDEQTGQLNAQKAQAELVQQQANAINTAYAKENPALDETKLAAGLKQHLWYDDKGNIRLPNLSDIQSFYSGLNDDNTYGRYVNEDQLNDNLTKYLDTHFAERGQNVAVPNTDYYWTATMRPYEQLDMNTGNVVLKTNPIAIGDKNIPLLNANDYKLLNTDRRFRVATNLMKDKMLTLYPDMATLPKEQQDAAAAAMLLGTISGKTTRTAPEKKVSEIAKYERQLAKDAQQRQHQNFIENVAIQRLSKKDEGTSKKAKPTYGDYFQSVMSGDETASSALPPVSVTKRVGDKVINSVSGYDITKALPDGLLNATDGTNDKVQIVYAPKTKSLHVQRFKKDAITSEYVPVGDVKEISKSNAANYLKQYKGQLDKKIGTTVSPYENGEGEIQQDINDAGSEQQFTIPTINIDFSNAPM